MAKTFLVLSSVFGFFSVAFGAFGAHALKQRLEPRMLEIFHTGVEYQFFHSFAIALVGILALFAPEAPHLKAAGWTFTVGIFIFSGSLYILSLSGVKTWGAVTPIGGVAFLIGWVLLGLAAWKGLGN